MTRAQEGSKTPLIAIVLAWTLVAIPLGWGLYQSLMKSMPLFSGTTSAPPAAPLPVAPAPAH